MTDNTPSITRKTSRTGGISRRGVLRFALAGAGFRVTGTATTEAGAAAIHKSNGWALSAPPPSLPQLWHMIQTTTI